RPIVLVAAVDLNQSLRQMLRQVIDHVTALIFAPQGWSEGFDAFGCLIPDAWQCGNDGQVASGAQLTIPDDALLEADDAADQCARVAQRIRTFDSQFRADEITIAVPDDQLAPALLRQLSECQLPHRYAVGQIVAHTGVCRTFRSLADFSEGREYHDFAALVRLPDIERWLRSLGVLPGWIEELDDYYQVHLPRRVTGEWLDDGQHTARLRSAYQAVGRLIRPFDGGPRPLGHWLPWMRKWILELYGDRTFDREQEPQRQAWMACRSVQGVLDEFATIPDLVVPSVTGADAVRMVLDRLSTARIPPVATEAAIELVGWLEASLDDAPAMIVTSFNEGFVPSSVNADLFLPGSLRTELGLDDNARRYARDAYAVATLLAPWRNTTFIVGRRDLDHDPLAPSRLLFAAPPETVARRALRFCGARAPRVADARRHPQDRISLEPGFTVPRPEPLPESITRLSVTAFKAYLECPYRYYLGRVLRLHSVRDDDTELDGAGFGTLCHNVLEQFGRGAVRDAHDPEVIRAEFDRLLNALAR
ncbi:MAG TPA: PD-(D/E)XK nuclease family protein, partial [Pirellulaceae bacterium]